MQIIFNEAFLTVALIWLLNGMQLVISTLQTETDGSRTGIMPSVGGRWLGEVIYNFYVVSPVVIASLVMWCDVM